MLNIIEISDTIISDHWLIANEVVHIGEDLDYVKRIRTKPK